METETPGAQVWLDAGAPDCPGEPVWQDRDDGRRHFTCPQCSLHWYIVRFIPPGTGDTDA